ncbi:hypothetical protein F4Z99_12515 [Candidatus Poribacteria bacterium]|nr:hypothetical protein [Candidatus Poribacteria bacterium]
MFNRTAKVTKVTWKTILVNPAIFTIMAFSPGIDTLGLIATSVIVVMSGLMPLGIPNRPRAVSIACSIVFAVGCAIGSLGLVNILEGLFPNLPTVWQWKWVLWMPSVFSNLAILAWIFAVLNISSVTRPLLISTVLIATAAGYALSLDVIAVKDALAFDIIRKTVHWEQGIVYLLNGSGLLVWAHFITRRLADSSHEKFAGKCTLFLGGLLILMGIKQILRDIFS